MTKHFFFALTLALSAVSLHCGSDLTSSCPPGYPLECGGGLCCPADKPYQCGSTCFADRGVANQSCGGNVNTCD